MLNSIQKNNYYFNSLTLLTKGGDIIALKLE